MLRALNGVSLPAWTVFAVLLSVSLSTLGSTSPIRIGADLGVVSDATVTVDGAGNPVVTFTADARVYLSHGFDGFRTTKMIDDDGSSPLVQDSPTIDTDSMGVTYVAYRKQNGVSVREVQWTHNPGGQFRSPELVPGSSARDVIRPHIEVASDGKILIGWSADSEDGVGRILYSLAGGPAQEILSGSDAAFDVDAQGTIHVAYIRDGDVYYSNSEGGDFTANEIPVTVSQDTESAPEIVVSDIGTPFVTYWAGEGENLTLYVTGGDWQHHRLVTDSPSCKCSSLGLGSGGLSFAVLFVENGQVWRYTGLPGLPSAGERLLALTGGVGLVDFALDQAAYTHVIYVQWGELFYTNNAPLPGADFSADPRTGEWPLEVSFESLSSGHILQYLWSFGDGCQSLLANPTHFYEAEGTYTVKLRVAGTAGAVSEVVKEDLITVGPKRNHMMVRDAGVYAGQKSVVIPIRATNDAPIQGFQIAARYDTEKLVLLPDNTYIGFEATSTLARRPEFVAPQHYPEEGYFTLGVIFDVTPPITGKMTMPGKDRNLLNILLDVKSNVPNRSEAYVRLENGLGDPPIHNIFTIQGGYSVYPELHNGVITIFRPDIERPGQVFIRGDANNNGAVEIGDGIFTLSFLFASGPAPFCMDSADFDDSGLVNIGDAIGTLSYLFQSTFPPPFPFPGYGLDSTPDGLPDC